MGTPVISYPPDEEILRQLQAHGTLLDCAQEFGFNESTLRRRIRSQGLDERARKAMKEAKTRGRKRETTHAYPPNDELVAAVVSAGSIANYADAVGISETTLGAHIRRQKLSAQIRDGLRAAKPALVAKPGDEVSREETMKAELAELRKLVAQDRKEDVAEARVIEALERGIRASGTTYTPRPRNKRSDKHAPHVMALLLSDAHAGEKVSLEETNGVNEYDWGIMLQRLRKLAVGVRSHNEHYGASRANVLHITSLGDGLSGSIHEELRETNDPPLSEAIVRYGVDIGEWIITELAEEFPGGIVMDCVVGNHPRFSVKPRAKVAYDNGDWIASEVTRIHVRNHKSITVRAPKASQAVVDICGRNVLLSHGDGVRTTMAGVPWGGIIRQGDKLRQLFAQSDVRVDHVFGGHWHNPQVAEDRFLLINGSIKGVDEYSIKKYGGGKPPSQLLTAFHPKHGLTGVHFIDL